MTIKSNKSLFIKYFIILTFNFILHFRKRKQQQQQSNVYSNTVLYNDNSTVNTSITSLLPNTTYTFCVLAVTSYGESEPICQNITTTNTSN